MKKFSLLRCLCFAAILMPQVALAEGEPYTINGSTLTITITSAGELSTFMSSATDAQKNAMKACTTIKLSGKFNSSDLTSIQASEGFSPTTVDMSEAQFVQTIGSSDSYKLYNGTVSGTPSPGTKAIQNVLQLYQSVQATQWNSANPSENDAGSATLYGNNDAMESARLSTSEWSYCKILNTTNPYKYCKLKSRWTMVGSTNSTSGLTVSEYSDCTSWPENELNTHTPSDVTPEATKVRVYRFYILSNHEWSICDASTWSNASNKFIAGEANSGLESATLDNLVEHTNLGEGTCIRFDIYYDWQKEWDESTNPTDEEKSNAYEASFHYAFKASHLSDNYNATSDIWVKMPNYDYYQLQRVNDPASYEWKPISFVDGDEKNPVSQIVTDANNLTTPSSADQYAVVCYDVEADKKIYNGSSWETYTGSNVIYDYSQMKFSYWQNVVNAVTSKYADSNISGDIFSGCNSIQTVDFKAGVVKGLTGKTTLQTLNVGRDVTEIASDALKESGVQTVTFDKNYTAEEKALATAYYNNQSLERPVYPKDLTIGEYAFQQCSNLSQIELPNRVISIGNSAFKQAGTSASELKVTFERRITSGTTSTSSIDYDHDLTIGTSAFYGCTTLKKIDLPIRLSSLGYDAFKLTSGLESVTMREDLEDSRLTTIPSGAFQESGLKSVKIPKSVTLIESNAFGSCYELTEIEFQESNKNPQPTLTIKTGAFAGGTETSYKLRTVKVDFTHEQRLTVCEFNAFNFTSLVGQTDVTSGQIATLEFPESDWNFYIGDWKKGLAFSQSNLNSFKDGYEGIRAEQEPTEASGGVVSTLKPANGWQQFAKTKTNTEILIPKGEFLRSFSVTKTYKIPIKAGTENTEYPVAIFKGYRVTNFSDGWNKGDDCYSTSLAAAATRKATCVEVPTYLPANTGLLLRGNIDQSYLAYLAEPTLAELEETPVILYPYQNDYTNTETANLLVPVGDATNIILNPTDPYPIGELTGDKYRIFGFSPSEKIFGRVKPNVNIKPNLAYLKLPISMFHWANEPRGNETGLPTGSTSRINLFFSDVDEDDVSGISSVNADVVKDGWYTLQGVKVSGLSHKGVYIHHGKKVFFK